jgi:predicted permease
VDPGFNPSHVLTLRVSYPPTRPLMRAGLAKFFSELGQQVASIPGVVSEGAVTMLPVAGGVVNSRGGNPFSIEGQQWHPDGPVPQVAHTNVIDADYFRAMQIPLRSGRFFSQADNATAQPVAIVNETLARGFFPKGAIGHQILLGAPRPDAPWLTIVGVVGDVKTAALSHDTMPQFYMPLAQDPPGAMSFVIRTALDPLVVTRAVAQAVRRMDPTLPVYDIITMDDRIAKSIGQPRFETTLLGFFAVSALFLAAIGIFGVVAHSTARRTQEIGIRMALGADSARVVGDVVWGGLRPVLAGIAIGLGGAVWISRALTSALFHVAPADPATFLCASAALLGVAAAACFAPARRASRIDPMEALRAE